MNKYLLRFLVAIVAFFAGSAVGNVSIPNTLTTSALAQQSALKRSSHIAQNHSPFSVLDGTTVSIKPFDASFEIPEDWTRYKPLSHEPERNLFLSREDLSELDKFDFNHLYGFDRKDAEVIRSITPFATSAAHLGSMSWGNGNTNDLQVRVSVVDLSSNEITDVIKNRGLSKAGKVFDRAELTAGELGEWNKQKMSVLEKGGHTLLFKDISFFYRSFGNKTVVFAFVHQYGWDETIKKILDSFRWKSKTEVLKGE